MKFLKVFFVPALLFCSLLFSQSPIKTWETYGFKGEPKKVIETDFIDISKAKRNDRKTIYEFDKNGLLTTVTIYQFSEEKSELFFVSKDTYVNDDEKHLKNYIRYLNGKTWYYNYIYEQFPNKKENNWKYKLVGIFKNPKNSTDQSSWYKNENIKEVYEFDTSGNVLGNSYDYENLNPTETIIYKYNNDKLVEEVKYELNKDDKKTLYTYFDNGKLKKEENYVNNELRYSTVIKFYNKWNDIKNSTKFYKEKYEKEYKYAYNYDKFNNKTRELMSIYFYNKKSRDVYLYRKFEYYN